MTNAEFVNALRDMASFFEARPELAPPYDIVVSEKVTAEFFGQVTPELRLDSKEGAAAFVRLIGGRIEKELDNQYLRLGADKGSFALLAVAQRNAVCEQVQVGVRVEPAHIIPAQEEQHIPERELPIYEWRCHSILAPEPTSDQEVR